METYRKTNKEFFFACAYLRNSFGIGVMTLRHIESGKWLTEDEIRDFTLAYLAGGEL